MSEQRYHVAQFNIARMRGEITDPVMAEFVANLDAINSAGEQAPGFVWRFKTDEGHSTSVRMYDDTYLIINMSVWESVDALFDFTYYSAHVELFRKRRDWFEKMDIPYLVLWWVPAGHEPTPEEGKARLEHLQAHGPSSYAFTFKQRFGVEAVTE
ncbi:MAG: DUF3291 domain-containing protein [Anaerolineae bacterium]|nr:DUF3291 domain-containing protein [Anaerolineae bacterium]